ncbi:receptor-like protein 9DC3 [Hevea brasiliensis]|uniref:receptor-like protein 9DC3 n=1 Tax=Hevea brasiliensis TaxID=3981 RepID=UPI0025FD4BDA|nr:receptor-like protein 9DC3 [Hevea brasiliensis]
MSLVAPSSLMNLSSSLASLKLVSCKLQGKIPYMSHLSKLALLDLSNNHLTLETMTFEKLVQNLSKWREVNLNGVNMSLVALSSLMNLSSSLASLKLEYCGLQGKILDNVFQQPNLQLLDLLGNEGLNGSLPRHDWNNSLQSLSLSRTKIQIHLEHDFISNLKSVETLDLSACNFEGSNLELFDKLTQLIELRLSHNNFSGQIPSSLENLKKLLELDLSHNNFNGKVPSTICKLKSLHILGLSSNCLNGIIPQCLGNFSNAFSMLHLGMNNFQGTIPEPFSVGCSLRYLNFNGSQLRKRVPLSISNCKILEILDLGNNRIDGTCPHFLETLPELQVLVLQSNELHGMVKGSSTNYSFSKLQIFDLSNNMLSGPLPAEYFNNFKAMMNVDVKMKYMGSPNYNYDYSASLTLKGLKIELVKIQTLLTTIDLSRNKL